VRSFEVTLSQPHTEDRFYMGALNMDEPMRSDFLAARWRLTQEYTTKTQMDAVINFTTGSPRILFRHPTALKTTSPGAVHNISAAGVFVITRASGSFITDGVLVGHALAGADAATYFPAGTTVTAVTATQVTVDKASLTGPTYAASNRTLTFTTNREVEIRSGSANLTDFSTPVEGFPAIIQTSTWEAWKDGTDLTALYLRIRNEKSALT
jgi:hypothetical protein